MDTISNEPSVSQALQFFDDRDKPVRLQLVTPIERGRVPEWVTARLAFLGQIFKVGDPWRVLMREFRPDEWGTATDAEGREVCVSPQPLPYDAIWLHVVLKEVNLRYVMTKIDETHRTELVILLR